MHPFEAAGLGWEPFLFLELEYSAAGDHCDYCGNCIHYVFWIAGGKDRFKVGSDCVKKVDNRLSRYCNIALKRFKEEQQMTDAEREFYDGFERVV